MRRRRERGIGRKKALRDEEVWRGRIHFQLVVFGGHWE